MAQSVSTKQRTEAAHDSEKEGIFKGLTGILVKAGYRVRRESLKRGSGWRVVSGSCETQGEKLIFVDRRLTKDDQISFLCFNIRKLGISPGPEQLSEFPEKIVQSLTANP